MRVLFFASDNCATAGDFLSMVNLIKEFKNMGIDSTVIVPKKDEGGSRLLEQNNIDYIAIKSWNWTRNINRKEDFLFKVKVMWLKFLNWLVAIRIAYIARKKRCDIVHINTMCSYIGKNVATLIKVPLVWHIREYLEEDQRLKIWEKEKSYKLVANSDAIIPVSKGIALKYENYFNKEKVHVIYNGVSTEFYNNQKILFNEQRVKLLMVGKICEMKGQIYAIKAVKEYSEYISKDIQLTLVGTGRAEYIKELEKIVKDYGLEKQITFEGISDNVKEYYSKADIFLMLSEKEAFGRVTIEAMMSGCAVIGFDCGGTSELVTNGKTGYLVEYGNVEGLVKTIEHCVKDKSKTIEIASMGRETAFNEYTVQANAKKINEVYMTLV